eukprot:TRINITY_DN4406_c0_g1_i1.p1 TRINITY_DN4406_c0_g1~~TRINITY_DN4406_c0_g1_i1.p1  ORF type:complete len:216 (+),score=39.91 TRINITY_DN4406_c0_g1_i1:551-1198(+)
MKDAYQQRYGKTSNAGFNLFAGAAGGVVTSFITNPIWVIKARMQTQLKGDALYYRHFADGLTQLIRKEGMKGMYRGIIPSILGVPHGSIQFMAYDELRKRLVLWLGNEDRVNDAHFVLLGAVSKVIASTATYPAQLLRTRMQAQRNPLSYSGLVQVAKATLKHEGIFGFYKGWVPTALRVTPASCVTFVVYERCMKWSKEFLSRRRLQKSSLARA